MTQEEFDALMNGDIDTDSPNSSEEPSVTEESEISEDGTIAENMESTEYQPNPSILWPPPPQNDEHKVVHQLDDVTKDGEEKATEMMGKLGSINNFFAGSETLLNELNHVFDKNIDIFGRLSERFPNVESFGEALKLNQDIKEKTEEMGENLQGGQDEVMTAMGAMQYQDTHRQKIERVINVMRALSHYMSPLFEGKIDDKKCVSSAIRIEGDITADVVSNDDIEALIAPLGQK